MQTERSRHTEPAPLLEWAMLFSLVIHLVAMLSMAALLLPGLPGGGNDLAGRMAYVVEHPWRWRLGWFPWQLTALSDLLISVVLLRTDWIPRLPALLALLANLAAILPEQYGEALWVTQGISLAQAGDAALYGAFETQIFTLTSAWGALFYAVTAAFWSWAFAAAGVWRRWLTWFSALLWTLFAYVSGGLLLPASLRPSEAFVAAGNAVGFTLLLVWFVAVTELLLQRSRPDGEHGRPAPWTHPAGGAIGLLAGWLANSRLVRALLERLPVMPMLSDITNVVYVNYMVEADRVAHLVPEGLELQRLGPGDRYAFFTFLSFRHGHFGPRLLGPLRRLLPSPVQTNWRIHVQDPRTGSRGIYFVTNAIDSTVHALGARLLSEGMPMHVLDSAEIRREGDGTVHLRLDPGAGSAPDAEATLAPAGRPSDGPWRACFGTYEEMLAYCVPQDRAFSTQPWHKRVTRQEINLGIPLDACEPLVGEVRSAAARRIVGEAPAFCFRVPGVFFRFEREEQDPL